MAPLEVSREVSPITLSSGGTSANSTSQVAARQFESGNLEIDESEKNRMLGSAELLSFMDQSTKIVQRTATELYDVTIDYSQFSTYAFSDTMLKPVYKFHGMGPIADLKMSPKFSELFLLSTAGSPGTVEVWNMHLSNRPEYTFRSQVCQAHSSRV